MPLLAALLLSTVVVSTASAQSISGDYRLVGIHVQYIDVLRDTSGSAAVEDANTTYDISVSWPSTVAAGAGFSFALAEFVPGDTVAAPSTPDALLTQAGLENFPLGAIDLTARLDDALGTLTIPYDNVGTSSYPTTTILNCSTYAVVADVTDNAIFALSSNSFVNTADNSITWGFGIVSSGIFALFEAIDPLTDPSAWPANWGMVNAGFTASDFLTVDTLVVSWGATDGVAADLGVDASGNLNRSLGVSVLDGSDDMVAQLNVAFAGLGANFNVGAAPMFVPPGLAESVGLHEDSVVSVNFAYVFDPFGEDEIPLNGDEPLQFTGYYFTYNLMVGLGGFETAFTASKIGGGSDSAAVYAGVDAGLQAMGAAGALAGATAGIVEDSVAAWLALGLTIDDVIEKIPVFAIGVALVVDAIVQSGFNPDDSDHDVDLANLSAGGRLIFEVDNVCLPVIESQYVTVTFVQPQDLAVNPAGDGIPTKFALHGNYPNPFNPSTTFSFDLPQQATAEVTIWNLLGQEVRTLHQGELPAGTHDITFDGRDNLGAAVPSGVYFYRLRTPGYVATKKMMLLK
ncbi:MAG: T9SS type A sorting domain-containing protein [Candidatus Marinimicrobia bacterium]|nr:T9SS type A sorting domain-containing protein [Candidatus Neomarinimicrobiota bacterium]